MIDTDLAPTDDDPDRKFLESLDWISPDVIDVVLADPANHFLPNKPQPRQPWLLYAALQFIAAAQRRYPVERALEERLKAFLDALSDGEIPDDLQKAGAWLKYLPGNRAKKHVRQDRLLKKFANDLRPPEPLSPLVAAERADDIEYVRSHVTGDEWVLLRRAAAEELATLAMSVGLAVGTLKSKLCRCRARLRPAF